MSSALIQNEHGEQSALMVWWGVFCKTKKIDHNLLFAIPNGGLRRVETARKLKMEGVRPGVPDLFLAVPAGDCHGLFIEMKRRKGGVLSENQKTMIDLLKSQGYCVVVAKGAMDAAKIIAGYLFEGV